MCVTKQQYRPKAWFHSSLTQRCLGCSSSNEGKISRVPSICNSQLSWLKMEVKVIIPLLKTSCLSGPGFSVSLKPKKAHPTSLAREWSAKEKPDKRDGQTCLKWEPGLWRLSNLSLARLYSLEGKLAPLTSPVIMTSPDNRTHNFPWAIEIRKIRHPINTEADQYVYHWSNWN